MIMRLCTVPKKSTISQVGIIFLYICIMHLHGKILRGFENPGRGNRMLNLFFSVLFMLSFSSIRGNDHFTNAPSLGITATHPIYSTTYHDWRLAGELEVGERVLTYKGEATVSSTEKRAGSETVYNLEVKDLHNFLVGDEGVVVHNGCIDLNLGKLKNSFINFEKALGWADAAAEEIVEDYVSGTLKDIAVETGKEVTEALAKSVRTSCKAFAKNILGDLLIEVAAGGFQIEVGPNSNNNTVSELHIEVTLKDGQKFVTIPDHAVRDLDGNLHFGEAKYTEVDKEWNSSTFRSASTDKQKKFIDAMESNNVASIKPLGPQEKLNRVGLTRHQVYTPEQIKIKSYHYMGSAKKSTTSIANKIK